MVGSPAGPQPPRRITWIGVPGDVELDLARTLAAEQAEISMASSVAAALATADAFHPLVVALASDRPDRFSLADAVALSRRWPLATVVSVATSLVEGRRRSGPALPGIEEVPWHDLAGRLACWLGGLALGIPGTLGPPVPLRREDRVLAGSRQAHRLAAPGPAVSVTAARADEVEGLVALLTAAGRPPVHRSRGRPDLDDPAEVLVWDLDAPGPADIGWLRLLTANRPGRRVILLVSFPRGSAVAEAFAAGAAAVLGRPVALEALLGTLLVLAPDGRTGLGRSGSRR